MGIAVTDTLPAYLEYVQMVSGPNPARVAMNGRQPVWQQIVLPRNGGSQTLAFNARVSLDAPSDVYWNRVDADAQGLILPSTDDTAPITVTNGAPTKVPSATPVNPTAPPSPETPVPTDMPGGPTSTPFVRIGVAYVPYVSRGW
jgi:hypothetical protein